jgi:hypothetical protein
MSFTQAKIVGAVVNPTEYHDIDQKPGQVDYPVSSSMLKIFNRCAARWHAGYKSPESKSTKFGTLLDCLALTPDAFKARFAVRPDTYKDKDGDEKAWHHASNTCKKWMEDHQDLEIATSTEYNEALTAARALQADQRISAMLADSDKQVWLSGLWQDEATGLLIPVRALLDFVPRPDTAFYKNLGDMKTARNGSPGAWARAVFDMGYHVQAAFNLDLYRAARPQEDRVNFCHIVLENYPPFQVGRRILSEAFLEIGRATYQRALANYAYCLKNNHWPDYDEGADSVQGWSITEPQHWMETDAMFAPTFGVVEKPDEPADEDGDVPP